MPYQRTHHASRHQELPGSAAQTPSQRAVIAVEFNRDVRSLSMRYINAP
jgi:hypothetical protein